MVPRTHHGVSRRALVAGAGAVVTALAGCTQVSEFIERRVTGDVNVFNTVDEHLTGTLELRGPAGESLLSEPLDLGPESGEDGEPAVIYEDVLTGTGTHELTLRVDATAESRERTVTESLQVTAPGREKIVVFLGGGLTGEFVTVRLVEDFAELESDIENA